MAGSDTPSGSNEATGTPKQSGDVDAWANAMLKVCSIDPSEAGVEAVQPVETPTSPRDLRDISLNAIKQAFKDFGAITDKAHLIVDREELKVFEKFEQEANDSLLDAEQLFDGKDYTKIDYTGIDDSLQNAHRNMDGMRAALERGSSTANRIDGYVQEVSDLLKEAGTYYKQRNQIPYEEQLSDLLSYQTMVETFGQEAKLFLSENRIADAKTAIEQMKTAIGNMPKCFEKPKNAKNAKKASADDVEYGLVSRNARAIPDDDAFGDVFEEEIALAERTDVIFALNQKVEADHKQDQSGWSKKSVTEFADAYQLARNALDGAQEMATSDLWLDSDVKKALPKIDSLIETARTMHMRMKKAGLAAQGLNTAEADEVIAADKESQGDVFENRLARLTSDLDSLRTALNTSNANWRPICQDVNGAEFDAIYQASLGHHENGVACAQESRDDKEAQCEQLQQLVSQVKSGLTQMQQLFAKAQETRKTDISEINARAKESTEKLQSLVKRRSEIEAWNVDLSAFDQAGTSAAKALQALNVAVKDKSAIRGAGELSALNSHIADLQEAFDAAAIEVERVGADMKFRFKNIKSVFANLAARKEELKKKPKEFAEFYKANNEAFTLITQDQAVLSNQDKKAADDLLAGVEVALGKMRNLLGMPDAGEGGVQNDASGRREELLQAVRDRFSQLKQLEKWANENPEVEGLCGDFDDTYADAQEHSEVFNVGLIELGNMDPKVVENALRAIDRDLDDMDTIFQAAKEKMEQLKGADAVADELTEKSDLLERIRAYNPEITKYQDKTGQFLDLGEKNFFKGTIANLKECLLTASDFYYKDEDAKGEAELDKVEVYFESLDESLKQAATTRREVKEFEHIVDMAKQSLADLEAKDENLKTRPQRNTFVLNSAEVKKLIGEVGKHIGQEDIKPIRDIIPQLQAAVQKMEEDFPKSRSEKVKAALGKKSKGTFEDELAAMQQRQAEAEAEKAAEAERRADSDEHLSEEEKQAKAIKKEIFDMEQIVYKACELMVGLDKKFEAAQEVLKKKQKAAKSSKEKQKLKNEHEPLTLYYNNREAFKALIVEIGELHRAQKIDEAWALIPKIKAAALKMEDEYPKTRSEKAKAALGKKKKKDFFGDDIEPKGGKKK
ncbi:hypothetical protein PSE_2187 [Pseudovibrio sp. FO-BEG1]|uniref:hypothetical protein n=1 Tax=Pseudovibrio sp. (strain FO-BEG1) TaxID=911045 RepID=UPI000238C58F|nr:hypothetical protein [Pseudovibrio sp. FO-BEG1]AEV36697.1 hypothetical protein PSE_2187 [Pseudovibrio sp. FO-BEG1]